MREGGYSKREGKRFEGKGVVRKEREGQRESVWGREREMGGQFPASAIPSILSGGPQLWDGPVRLLNQSLVPFVCVRTGLGQAVLTALHVGWGVWGEVWGGSFKFPTFFW